jgi:hypothetical protein
VICVEGAGEEVGFGYVCGSSLETNWCIMMRMEDVPSGNSLTFNWQERLSG